MLIQVRCSKCNARLYDSKIRWVECSVRDAINIVKCWRCDRLVSLMPDRRT